MAAAIKVCALCAETIVDKKKYRSMGSEEFATLFDMHNIQRNGYMCKFCSSKVQKILRIDELRRAKLETKKALLTKLFNKPVTASTECKTQVKYGIKEHMKTTPMPRKHKSKSFFPYPPKARTETENCSNAPFPSPALFTSKTETDSVNSPVCIPDITEQVLVKTEPKEDFHVKEYLASENITNIHLNTSEFTSKLMNNLCLFQQKSFLCDCTIECVDGTLSVHKVVLAMWGVQDLKEFINARNYTVQEVMSLIQFLYTGRSSISMQELSKFTSIGSKIGITFRALQTNAHATQTVGSNTSSLTNVSLHDYLSQVVTSEKLDTLRNNILIDFDYSSIMNAASKCDDMKIKEEVTEGHDRMEASGVQCVSQENGNISKNMAVKDKIMNEESNSGALCKTEIWDESMHTISVWNITERQLKGSDSVVNENPASLSEISKNVDLLTNSSPVEEKVASVVPDTAKITPVYFTPNLVNECATGGSFRKIFPKITIPFAVPTLSMLHQQVFPLQLSTQEQHLEKSLYTCKTETITTTQTNGNNHPEPQSHTETLPSNKHVIQQNCVKQNNVGETYLNNQSTQCSLQDSLKNLSSTEMNCIQNSGLDNVTNILKRELSENS